MTDKIPLILIYLRFCFGLLTLFLSYSGTAYLEVMATILISAGLLSDIMDGIIARKLKVSTEKLRRLDSTIDLLFFLSIVASTWLLHPEFYRTNWLKLTFLLGSEALAYLICYIKFRKEVATHTLGAKFWTLILFSTLVELIWSGNSTWLFECCIWLGILTRFEIIAIILILNHWQSDIPWINAAIRSRKGKAIKRNKLFNG